MMIEKGSKYSVTTFRKPGNTESLKEEWYAEPHCTEEVCSSFSKRNRDQAKFYMMSGKLLGKKSHKTYLRS